MSDHELDEVAERPAQSLRTSMLLVGQVAEHIARKKERAAHQRGAALGDGDGWQGMHRHDALENASPVEVATAYESARRAGDRGDDRAQATAEAVTEWSQRQRGVDLEAERRDAQQLARREVTPEVVVMQASDPQWRAQASDSDLVSAWAVTQTVVEDETREVLHDAARDAQRRVESSLTERGGVDPQEARTRLADAMGVEVEARQVTQPPTPGQVSDPQWRAQASDSDLVRGWSVATDRRHEDPVRWAGVRDTIEGEMTARGGAAAAWAERAEEMRAVVDAGQDSAGHRLDADADRLRAESRQQWQEHVVEEHREERAETRMEKAEQKAGQLGAQGHDAAAERAEDQAGSARTERDHRNTREDRAEDRSRSLADAAERAEGRGRFREAAAREGGASETAIDARRTSASAFGRSTTEGITASSRTDPPAKTPKVPRRARDHGLGR